MSTSVIPAVIDALVAQAAAALPSVNVFDGFGVVNDTGNYLMVGTDDPSQSVRSIAAQASQTTGPMGTSRPRDESGSIICAALAWNGNGNAKDARDAAFAVIAAVEALLRADPQLGLTGGPYLVAEMGDGFQLEQTQSDQGAEALVGFSVRFRARI
ncbi:MAG: hypothetical protein NTX33_04780 [Propionibacteriales bacterium]|nr:hypothetical protein [Propionibacteriales bacterium]